MNPNKHDFMPERHGIPERITPKYSKVFNTVMDQKIRVETSIDMSCNEIVRYT